MSCDDILPLLNSRVENMMHMLKNMVPLRLPRFLEPKQNTSSIEPIRTAAIKDLTFRQNTATAELELTK
ncbi:hypothetical protein ABIB30_000843 [Pedobacter sp. UYP1]